MGTYQVLRYPLHIVEVWPDQEKVCLWTSPSVVVWAFALKHGIPALGFRFQEQERPARLDATKAAHLNLSPAEIACLRAQGFIAREGQTYTWAALSLPSAAPRSYVYCSDTCFEPALVSFVKGANMLYHEATFLSAQAERARQTYHATAAQAATLAKLAQAKQLLIGHFSARYKDLTPFLQEAQVIFPATTLAQEGHTYTIPEHA
jgi:ribonuclease Z